MSLRPWAFLLAALALPACSSGGGSGGGTPFVPSAEPVWSLPEEIDAGEGTAIAPQIGIDADGNAIAVWQQNDGTRDNIWAARYVAGTGWAAATLIETNDTGNAMIPRIAVSSGGSALVVWQHAETGLSNIWANRYLPGAGWGTAALIESDDAGDAITPIVGIDDDGEGMAVWAHFDGTFNNIRASRFDGASWGAPQTIDGTALDSSVGHHLSMEGSGKALAVWTQYDSGLTNIWAARFNGTAWGGAVLIETENLGSASQPYVAMDGFGNGIAVWQYYDGGVNNVRGAFFDNLGGWNAVLPLETATAQTATNPRVDMGPSRRGMGIFQLNNGSRDDVFATRYSSPSWGTAVAVESLNTGSATQPRIQYDAQGHAVAVWQQFDGTRDNLWTSSFTDLVWHEPALLETEDAGDASFPELVLDGAGRGFAVWQQFDGTRVNIYAAKRE